MIAALSVRPFGRSLNRWLATRQKRPLGTLTLDRPKRKQLLWAAVELVEAAGIEPASVDPIQSGLHA